MLERAEVYAWSSAAAHVASRDTTQLLDLGPWQVEYGPARWSEVLRVGADEEALGERLHQATQRGRPLGEEEFRRELEAKSGRRLTPRTPGRPGKERALVDLA